MLDTHRALRDRHLFVPPKQDNLKKNIMAHNLITKHLSKCFEKAQVFADKPASCNRVSCSRIRFSINTELVALGEDSLNSIAHCHGKHRAEVCKKYYIQFFSNRKAGELSWKSYERCRTLTKEEEKASNTCFKLLVKKALPTFKVVHKWYIHKRYKDLKSYHKVYSNVDMTEKGLEEILKPFQYERALRKDG